MHVGVHDTHPQALGGQGAGEVDGDGRLTHAAFSTRHGVDLRQGPGLGEGDAPLTAGTAQLFLQGLALGAGHDLQLHVNTGDACDA